MEKKNLTLKAVCLILVGLLAVPAFLLTFSTGTDGELTWGNFAGIGLILVALILGKWE